MAFAHGEICKTIAMVAQLSAPYLTEGATKIDQSELAGKRVGESYKFSFDTADIAVGKNGMQTSFGNSGAVTSNVGYLKIWDAAAKIANSALDKKLSAGNWEDFAKQTGVDVINAMVKEVAVMDMGKVKEAIPVANVNKVVEKSLVMNQYGSTVRAYGSYNGIGAILGSSKLNAPMLSDDKYANGKSWSFGNFTTMRCVPLPTLNLITTATSDTVTLAKAGTSSDTSTIAAELAFGLVTDQWYASATSKTLTGASLLKIGDNTFVYFPAATGYGIVIGDKTGLAAGTAYCKEVTSAKTYEPIIIRADGAQGAVDASSLIEAADGQEGYEGVGVAHSSIKEQNRGVTHYYDVAGAYGIARGEASRVLLLEA